jgi:hypothetical protein
VLFTAAVISAVYSSKLSPVRLAVIYGILDQCSARTAFLTVGLAYEQSALTLEAIFSIATNKGLEPKKYSSTNLMISRVCYLDYLPSLTRRAHSNRMRPSSLLWMHVHNRV